MFAIEQGNHSCLHSHIFWGLLLRFEDNASVYRLYTCTSENANIDLHW